MFALIAFSALLVVAMAATVVDVVRDGYGRIPTRQT